MYLLNEALRLKNNELFRQSLVIDQEKISYVRERLPYWKKRKVNMEGIVLAPAKVGMCIRMLNSRSEQEREDIERQWLSEGVTTIIVLAEIEKERNLHEKLEAVNHKMKKVSLDYVVAITIPLKLLKPSLLRLCRRLKIPLIEVRIDSRESLSRVAWSRLAEASLTYPCVLVPSTQDIHSTETTRLWQQQSAHFGLTTASSKRIWSKELLQKSGIYPQKGELLVGSDADYLLYKQLGSHQLSRKARKLAASHNLDYDRVEAEVVVRRGQILKANQSYFLYGDGKQIQVNKPKRMLSLNYATKHNVNM
ncbi:hypothetical protein [Alkalicoccobacillus porphyridii]|uniref:Amidohydrolase family protein n=1 Tax=Alkalicoccobacillus porphyridii TaxID=2597270 RepID=A0A553ZZQ2_9BACI|nr:hypothetical protein [Alkalicoccobacillus porphyridii]TSB46924.1 hypothetical protein FN960_07845 [Alkalicoccobacillus porphyridii]